MNYVGVGTHYQYYAASGMSYSIDALPSFDDAANPSLVLRIGNNKTAPRLFSLIKANPKYLPRFITTRHDR